MSTTMGRVLADAVGDTLGIQGPFFACEADAEEITIWRGVHTTDGSIAVTRDAAGEVVAVQVAETFDLNTER